MSSAGSTGLQRTAALDFLIRKRILSADPLPGTYQRQTYHDDATLQEEELVTTRSWVVWSRGGVIQQVLNFDREDQKIKQAVLTWLEISGETANDGDAHAEHPTSLATSSAAPTAPRMEQGNSTGTSGKTGGRRTMRSLVVLLDSEAHVASTDGSSHIVNLPFEVDRAFPTHRGLILQRKVHGHENVQPSPIIPDAPANSFLANSAPLRPRNSFAASKSVNETTGSSRPTISLKDFKIAPEPRSTDNLPRLFTLTDPLAPIGLVVETSSPTYQPSSPFGRLSDSFSTSALSHDEELLYVSRSDELSNPSPPTKQRPLMLAMTVNRAERAYNLWYASYLEAKSVVSWMRSLEAARLKARRKSFANGLDRGSTPSEFGRRSGARESFMRSFQDNVGHKPAKREGGRQSGSFVVKASHGNPSEGRVPELTSPGMTSVANRRTSSMLARAELSTQERAGMPEWTNTTTGTASGAPRRGVSFGRSTHDRQSLRMSQGSTRASLPDHTANLDDSLMKEKLSDLGEEDSIAPSGYEDFVELGIDNPFEGMSGKLMLKKVFSIPIRDAWDTDFDQDAMPAPASETKVLSLTGKDGQSLRLFVHNKRDHVLSEIILELQKPLYPGHEQIIAPVLNHAQVRHHFKITNVEQVTDGDSTRLLLLCNSHLFLFTSPAGRLPLSTAQIEPADDFPRKAPVALARSTGPTLSIGAPRSIKAFTNAGGRGRIDLVDASGQLHPVLLSLQPSNAYARRVLHLSGSLVLRTHDAGATNGEDILLAAYWQILKVLRMKKSASEWTCVVITLLAMFLASSALTNPPNDQTPSIPSVPRGTWRSNWNWRILIEQDPSPASQTFIQDCATMARDCLKDQALTDLLGLLENCHDSADGSSGMLQDALPRLVLGLHLLRQEELLDINSEENSAHVMSTLAPVLAQMGQYLAWEQWSWRGLWFSSILGSEKMIFDTDTASVYGIPSPSVDPPSIPRWLVEAFDGSVKPFPSVVDVQTHGVSNNLRSRTFSANQPSTILFRVTPRSNLLSLLVNGLERAEDSVGLLSIISQSISVKTNLADSLPESILVLLKRYLIRRNIRPGSTWPGELLQLFDRGAGERSLQPQASFMATAMADSEITPTSNKLSVEEICDDIDIRSEQARPETQGFFELIYRHDTSFDEAQKILRSHTNPIAISLNNMDLPEAKFLEMERKQAQLVGVRSLAVSTGAALLEHHSFTPLFTQPMEIGLWDTQIRMSPSGHIMTLAKEHFTEQMSAWAAYHAGVAAGLKLRAGEANVTSSWILFNKPTDLSNRHAGLLLGLGFNGYLRTMEKWLVFKYLTPKHDMTSISLLLGLGASYIGTMNSLVVRVLSIHLVSLLPPGAAELNLSPLVQTAGTMGVGLLYYNSQHRRMSEVMLSELEYIDKDDLEGVFIRDEGYRLAAGFALGFINLGHGANLRALHDMRIKERLMHLITTSRDTNIVNVLDRATPGATIALALMFMKTHDAALAKKVDVPSTRQQFDYVRPDVALLRVVARNLIMWDEIEPSEDWLFSRLPADLQEDIRQARPKSKGQHCMAGWVKSELSSVNMHLYNIIAGLCWSISLKYAGSGNKSARDCILKFYDNLAEVQSLQPVSFDHRLTFSTVSRLQHLLLLSAATVMAATGDLEVFRRTRICHANVTPDSTFGTHQATHMAIGALFMAQGQYTFCTSDLAVASLLCAFYPLFAKDVQDNKAHLQAFRHMWVFAIESRCLMPLDTETRHPVLTMLEVTLRDMSKSQIEAPAVLIPGLETVASVRTLDEQYDPVVLDFVNDPTAIPRFKKDQTIWLKRRSLLQQYNGDVWAATLAERRATAFLGPTRPNDDPFSKVQDDIFALPLFSKIGMSTAHLDTTSSRALSHAEQNDALHSHRGDKEREEWDEKRKKEREDRKKRKMQQVLMVPGVMNRYRPTAAAGEADDPLLAGFFEGGDDSVEDVEALADTHGGPAEWNEGAAEQARGQSLLELGTSRMDDVLALWGRSMTPAGREELNLLFKGEEEAVDSYDERAVGRFGREVYERLKVELALRDAGLSVEGLLDGPVMSESDGEDEGGYGGGDDAQDEAANKNQDEGPRSNNASGAFEGSGGERKGKWKGKERTRSSEQMDVDE